MNFYLAAAAVVLVICTHAAAYVIGNERGATAERGAWIAREGERTQALADTLSRVEGEYEQRAIELQDEVKALRARPPQVRTVIEPAKDCKALPPDWRQHWND